jgi:hypothetical protein
MGVHAFGWESVMWLRWTALIIAPCLATQLCVAQGSRRHARTDRATSPRPCRVVCAPSLSLMPGAIRTHLFHGPVVRSVATGVKRRLPSTSDFELILAVAARTAIPRVSLFGSVQWLPNASESRNPFTLYTASELGSPIRANAPTVTMGGSLSLLPATRTHGWLDLAGNVGDLYSQAARPSDRGAYTHKLDLDLVAHLHAFDWAPAATWLHRVTVFSILDYVATGLPRAGDEVPVGRVFITGARPAALIAGLSLPLSPAAR